MATHNNNFKSCKRYKANLPFLYVTTTSIYQYQQNHVKDNFKSLFISIYSFPLRL